MQAPFDADKLLERALRFWGDPPLSSGTRRVLRGYADRALATAGTSSWKRKSYPALIENSLRHLIAVSPDFQTS